MPPTSAAVAAVDALPAALALELALELPPDVAGLELLEPLELLELELLQPAASRMLPIAAPTATIALDARKVPSICNPAARRSEAGHT
jgi:hypothetical protein